MRKKVIFIVLILALCIFTFGLIFLKNVDYSTYGNVKYIKEDDVYGVTYQNRKYYPAKEGLFDIVCDYTEDVELGWYFNFPITFGAYYYSNRLENPLYMYCSATDEVYIREDYDYESDIFVIEGTDIEIVFSEAFTQKIMKKNSSISYSNTTSFLWHSKSEPELQIYAEIFNQNNSWYMNVTPVEAWELSNDFVSLLLENKITS